MADIGYTIVLDDVRYVDEAGGFESTFHLEKIEKPTTDVLELTRKKILHSMLVMCSACKRMRMTDGQWVAPDYFLLLEHDTPVSHSLCPQCYEKALAEIEA